jgi:3-deoxy-manno-octulosonate cytidylyltransferase (CMP-KDO synthetase)
MTQEAIAVIPARYGSVRFPGKPLALICGEPLIQHVWKRANEARSISRVLVATDDQRIMDVVIGFGGEAVMTSPEHVSGSDRIGEVALNYGADIIVNVQGDEPFMDPEVIDRVVAPFDLKNPPDIVTAATRIKKELDYLSPDVVKVVMDASGQALYFSRASIPYSKIEGDPQAYRHIGIYAYTKDALLRFTSLQKSGLERTESLEQLRALENGMKIMVVKVDDFESIGIDRPEDIQRAEGIMKKMGNMPEGESTAGIEEGS